MDGFKDNGLLEGGYDPALDPTWDHDATPPAEEPTDDGDTRTKRDPRRAPEELVTVAPTSGMIVPPENVGAKIDYRYATSDDTDAPLFYDYTVTRADAIRSATIRTIAHERYARMHKLDKWLTINQEVNNLIDEHNRACAARAKERGQKSATGVWATIGSGNTEATPDMLARFLISAYSICRIQTTDERTGLPLYIYLDRETARDEDSIGTYTCDTETIGRLIHDWCPGYDARKLAETLARMRELAPIKEPTRHRDLVPCKNVIYNARTRETIPYSPEYVFLAKLATNYVENAPMPRIEQRDGTIWTPDSLLPSFTSNPEIAKLLWGVLKASVLSNRDWHISPWLYSTTGNNGKGTFCRLVSNLIGESNVAHLSILDMSDQYRLASIVGKYAVIADENPVSIFVDRTDDYKKMVTHDTVTINQKYQVPYDYKFMGIVIQCINDFPKIKDRSESFVRRLVTIEFDQSFKGRENPDIKSDYLARPEVLEWFLYMALNLRTLKDDRLDIPAPCKKLMESYRDSNDPVRAFVHDVKDKLVWDLIPNSFAYALYRAWHAQNDPASALLGRNHFRQLWTQAMCETGEWVYRESGGAPFVGHRCDSPEPLIEQYHLAGYLNSTAKSQDGRCTPKLPERVYGLIRTTPSVTPDASDAHYAEMMADLAQTSSNACSTADVLEITSFDIAENTENSETVSVS